MCIDKNLADVGTLRRQLRRSKLKGFLRRMTLSQLDLTATPWPFGPQTAGGIVNVHFLSCPLLACFSESLLPGAYLLLETAPACGRNYLDLPMQGELRGLLENSFDIEFYKERRAGPPESGKVTVKLIARRRPVLKDADTN